MEFEKRFGQELKDKAFKCTYMVITRVPVNEMGAEQDPVGPFQGQTPHPLFSFTDEL